MNRLFNRLLKSLSSHCRRRPASRSRRRFRPELERLEDRLVMDATPLLGPPVNVTTSSISWVEGGDDTITTYTETTTTYDQYVVGIDQILANLPSSDCHAPTVDASATPPDPNSLPVQQDAGPRRCMACHDPDNGAIAVLNSGKSLSTMPADTLKDIQQWTGTTNAGDAGQEVNKEMAQADGTKRILLGGGGLLAAPEVSPVLLPALTVSSIDQIATGGAEQVTGTLQTTQGRQLIQGQLGDGTLGNTVAGLYDNTPFLIPLGTQLGGLAKGLLPSATTTKVETTSLNGPDSSPGGDGSHVKMDLNAFDQTCAPMQTGPKVGDVIGPLEPIDTHEFNLKYARDLAQQGQLRNAINALQEDIAWEQHTLQYPDGTSFDDHFWRTWFDTLDRISQYRAEIETVKSLMRPSRGGTSGTGPSLNSEAALGTGDGNDGLPSLNQEPSAGTGVANLDPVRSPADFATTGEYMNYLNGLVNNSADGGFMQYLDSLGKPSGNGSQGPAPQEPEQR
jgi:hypothetical protein